jgi:ABC-type transporter MlaC component
MKRFFSIFSLFITLLANAQNIKKDSTEVMMYLIGNDTVLRRSLDLDEVVVTEKYVDRKAEERKKFLILYGRVMRVYPYAKEAAQNLTMLNTNMAKMKTKKEQKKYLKIVENYLENEFEDRLKNLSRKDGQILIKLIHRQTGNSTYDLVKDFKGGWKAFWATNTAKVFDLDLKKTYDPYNVSEDYMIEGILIKCFREGRLTKQKDAIDLDYNKLLAIWKERIDKAKADKE